MEQKNPDSLFVYSARYSYQHFYVSVPLLLLISHEDILVMVLYDYDTLVIKRTMNTNPLKGAGSGCSKDRVDQDQTVSRENRHLPETECCNNYKQIGRQGPAET